MTTPTPPPYPSSFLIPPDIICDYLTGLENLNPLTPPPYGFTGLMTVVQWTSSFYEKQNQGQVAPGTVFLFPANDITGPPAYCGKLYINGNETAPLSWTPGGTARHQLLCNLLNPYPEIPGFSEHFIGFSTKFPWWEKDHTKYNSNTCNPFWFGEGKNHLPEPWENVVNQALSSYLPDTVRTPISPKVQWDNKPMVLTLQTDGSLSLETLIPKSEVQVWDFVPGPTLATGQPSYYIVNPYQQPTGSFLQLFGDGTKGDALSTGPFDPSNVSGQWRMVPVTPPYFYLYSLSGNGSLVMDSRGGSAKPGTAVQLYTTNNGPGQIWAFNVPVT